jgi:TetR/AcrR family transcriptional repressor of nem operon
MGRPLKSEPDVIVDKAVHLSWRQGYSGTTPMGMVKELGIGSLYRSFESMHYLFSLALRRYSADRHESLVEGLEGDGPMRQELKAAAVPLSGVGSPERSCFLVNSSGGLGMSTGRGRRLRLISSTASIQHSRSP